MNQVYQILNEGRGKTARTEMEYAAHAIGVRTAVPFVFSENFLRFHSRKSITLLVVSICMPARLCPPGLSAGMTVAKLMIILRIGGCRWFFFRQSKKMAYMPIPFGRKLAA